VEKRLQCGRTRSEGGGRLSILLCKFTVPAAAAAAEFIPELTAAEDGNCVAIAGVRNCVALASCFLQSRQLRPGVSGTETSSEAFQLKES
jgi:hypothetical protein